MRFFSRQRLEDYLTLCKAKVVLVMLITSGVGMYLATPSNAPFKTFILATLGIAFSGSSAAVINHLVDRQADAQMSRTLHRPLVAERVSFREAVLLAFGLGVSGLGILSVYVNLLTAGLTFFSLLGYAALYTLFLKRRTPQNIVIGGAAGAMPPLLGWTAIHNETHALPWLLVLIIFAWTPPHFWALAISKEADYEKANIPMLPITHGVPLTKLFIVLYVILLWVITLLPYVIQMCGLLYLSAALLLGGLFLRKSLLLYRTDSKAVALQTFGFSITYLLLLFTALLIDHSLYF